MPNDPKWWNEQHSSTWERVKAAMKRDWKQTKADLTKGGTELDQDVDDTVKQAMGKQAIPPANQPNPPSASTRASKPSKDDEDWTRVEHDYRYGVGAREQYRDEPDWNDRVESKLKEEWSDLRSGRTWDEARTYVRRGWDRGRGK
jgi:hypothetical protein